MNRKMLFVAVMTAAVVQSVQASDGTINFAGELVAQTCTITIDGGPSPQTKNLPKVSTSLLTTPGQVAGATSFLIGLTGCASTPNSVTTFYEAGGTVDPITGRMRNTAAGGADEVELQLLDGGPTAAPILIGSDTQTTTNTRYTIDASGAVTMPYAVQYYATGTTTPGIVESQVTFSIDYQ
ncbi:fimbrial protein [Pseudomonas proteolytica]|uniref:fimbrial protein n=1 Tax=Pseudomonas proteolytica TaxID=219574 RepID=UPI001474432B|nr:fimbrial protein [Pseudomonas proteolytica]NMZ32846.1 type 1 fimbrial protein [Pseudomonas proteolytica]